MMRAWGNRADTVVVDEPFYAVYLAATKLAHPGAEEIIAAGETDAAKVIQELTDTPLPPGRHVQYQKQMTHHLLPSIDRRWLARVHNCFLLREPAEVIASYLRKNGEPVAEDLGFIQQAEIFDFVCAESGKIPPVIDAADVLADPEKTLRLLCGALSVPWTDAMLSWPPGLRATDGVWAKHWYREVQNSTGFAPPRGEVAKVPPRLGKVYEQCRESYERLRIHRLRADVG